MDLEAGHPHTALRAHVDSVVVAILKDEAFVIWGPPQQNAPPAVWAEPFLLARFRVAVKNHLVCLSH